MRQTTLGPPMTAGPLLRPSRLALAGAVALVLAGACGDHGRSPVDEGQGPLGVGLAVPSIELLSTLVVSNPLTSTTAAGAGLSLGASSSSDEVVFVSLPPGSVPDGEMAVIRTRATQAQAAAAMVDGGFDPIPVAAGAGDTLDIRIQLAGGRAPLLFHTVVPPSIPPVIVRTDPPPLKHDVPLNVFMRVVFSEPIDVSTLTASSVHLLLDGEPVAGTLQFADGMNLTATFTPAEQLAPEAGYSLVITRAIEDLDGEALSEEYRADFTTAGSSVTVQAVKGWDPATFEQNPWYSYRWWTGPEASSGDCPMNRCPARRLTVSRISEPAAVVLEIADSSGNGFEGVIGGYVPPGAVAAHADWVVPTTESVRYRVTVTLLDGQAGSAEFDSYDPVAFRLPAAAIAFVSNRDGVNHIWVANADGSGVTRVSDGTSPAWSPDGRKLAFVREESRAGPAGIYVLDRDGSGMRFVGPGWAPTWSPDGRISFIGLHPHSWIALYVMNADGSGVTKLLDAFTVLTDWGVPGTWLPNYQISNPTWSPDGRNIWFQAGTSGSLGAGALEGSAAADGSDPRELEALTRLGRRSRPAWSPDGSRIAVITHPGSWQERCDGWLGVCWSGSGFGKSSVIYTYDVNSDLALSDPQVIYTDSEFLALSPDWSPDGSHVVFAGDFSPQDALKGSRIFTVSLETGLVRQLIPDAIDPVAADYSDRDVVWSRGKR